MIVITKHGREYKAPTPPIYYSCTCRYCGCEFEFSNRDIDWTYDRVSTDGRPAFFIDCPECNKRIYEWSWQSQTEG